MAEPDTTTVARPAADAVVASRQPPSALPEGYRLEGYRIDGVLGQGPFGITYRATDVHLNAPVVIKEYLPEDIAFRQADSSVSPNASRQRDAFQSGVEAFLVEARTLASLRHPAIVRVLRFFEANRTAYMVLEFEAGTPLRQWWPQHQQLGEEGLVERLAPLFDGLAVLHASGVLHRDIRPDNIQVRDEDGRFVLLDFRAPRQAIAVAGYAAPEQHERGELGPWTCARRWKPAAAATVKRSCARSTGRCGWTRRAGRATSSNCGASCSPTT
jgi:serine/threonine protein kinase